MKIKTTYIFLLFNTVLVTNPVRIFNNPTIYNRISYKFFNQKDNSM